MTAHIESQQLSNEEYLAQEDVARVAELIRRSEPRGDWVIDSVTSDDEALAKISRMNLEQAVWAYGKNTARFGENHIRGLETVRILGEHTLASLAEFAEAPSTPVYSVTFTHEEAVEIANTAGWNEAVHNDMKARLGIEPANPINIDSSQPFEQFRKVWQTVNSGQGFGMDLPLCYAPTLKLYAANMTSSHVFNTRLLGVSDYGETYTDKLFQAHANFARRIHSARPEFEQFEADYRHRLVRGRSAHAHQKELSSQMSVHEGTLSIAQALAVLTLDIDPHYDNPDDLVTDLIMSGTVTAFAKGLYTGVVGPMSLAGLGFRDAYVVTGEGVELSRQAKEVLASSKRRVRERASIALSSIQGTTFADDLIAFKGCPAAFHGTAKDIDALPEDSSLLQEIAELYLQDYVAA